MPLDERAGVEHDAPANSSAMKPLAPLLLVAALVAAPALTMGQETSAPATPPAVSPAPPPPAPAAPADVQAAPADAEKTPSGLASKVLSRGTGAARPSADNVVTVNYSGWTADGKLIDSSATKGQAASFRLDKVIKGLTEGIQLMVQGEKRRFWIPAELAYAGSASPTAPKGMVVFDVELLRYGPAVPEDVAAVPATAEKTASGLASRVLRKGTGTDHPKATDTVKVHYTGWTLDGKQFDSSVERGEPTEFPLNGVIKGWTEGVQLMVVGEKRRFWIPANLAYGDNAGGGAPSGMLVFDIELLEVKK